MLFRRVHRLVATGLLVVYLPACSSWRVQDVTPAQMLQEGAPRQLRVTRRDGSEVMVTMPHVSADSLVGLVKGAPGGVPLGEVRAVAVRRGDALKTVGLVSLIVGGLVIVAALAVPNPLKGLQLCLEPPCEEEE